MKILIVAMSDSIHTARWIAQIADQGWEIHIFPSIDYGYVHPEMANVHVHNSVYGKHKNAPHNVEHHGIPILSNLAASAVRNTMGVFFPRYRTRQLIHLINRLKPDIVHSLEIQHAGYLTLAAKKLCKRVFPLWIVTNWGSDIYLFGRLAEHREKIKEVLAQADYYSCECVRDVCLAKAYGYTGQVLPVFPNTGGFDLRMTASLRQEGPVDRRRVIMVKGYQTWAGRALVALRALERCADMLNGYTVAIHSASPDVELAAELFQGATRLPVVIIPKETSHHEMLAWHGRSRISVGLSISDAISTSLLEAIVMGSFPIQSWTSCADEWIEDGKTGILVPPEDPDIVEKALRKALADDELVNRAAELNYNVAELQLDYRKLKKKAVEIYRQVEGNSHMVRNKQGER